MLGWYYLCLCTPTGVSVFATNNQFFYIHSELNAFTSKFVTYTTNQIDPVIFVNNCAYSVIIGKFPKA